MPRSVASEVNGEFSRFNVTPSGATATDDYRNEASTYGYIVEIDPYNASTLAVKRTALGRFRHEGCCPGLPVAGKPLVYKQLRLIDQACRKRNVHFFLDRKQDVLPGHAGKTFAHFLDRDRVTGFRQKLRLDLGRDDLGIDEHAVAIENDHAAAHAAIRPSNRANAVAPASRVSVRAAAVTSNLRVWPAIAAVNTVLAAPMLTK